MSAASAEEMRKHLKVYYMVFGALAVLTVVTVGVAELHFLTVPQAIAVALAVAIVKGSLVACYFMHLLTERGMVFWILGICGLFFIVLLFIPVVTVKESVGLH
jgi:cytochrome c oxidase subunit 4